ncbi:hypothetical protein ACPV5F_24580, partial [Vibrio alfacsensis]
VSSVVEAQYFTLNQLPEQNSVGQRLYIYNSANKVDYCITTSGQIERNGIRVATNIDPVKSSFTHLEASLLRSALVRLNLVFNQA